MTPDEINGQMATRKVSVLGRLVPAFSYAIPPPAAAISAVLLMDVMRAIRMAESVGLAAVAEGIAEANLPILIALSFAIAVGVIGIVVAIIRLFVTTTTASPSAWFLLIAGGLGLTPLLLLWKAESLLVEGMSGKNIASMASSIEFCLTITIVIAVAVDLILLVASLVRLPAILRAKRNYAPLIVLVLMLVAMIGMAIAFQTRTSWLHQVRLTERF